MSKLRLAWIFEAVNGRSATEEEIAQALAAGEFVEAEQVSAEQVSSEASPASSSFEQPQNFQQPFAQQAFSTISRSSSATSKSKSICKSGTSLSATRISASKSLCWTASVFWSASLSEQPAARIVQFTNTSTRTTGLLQSATSSTQRVF